MAAIMNFSIGSHSPGTSFLSQQVTKAKIDGNACPLCRDPLKRSPPAPTSKNVEDMEVIAAHVASFGNRIMPELRPSKTWTPPPNSYEILIGHKGAGLSHLFHASCWTQLLKHKLKHALPLQCPVCLTLVQDPQADQPLMQMDPETKVLREEQQIAAENNELLRQQNIERNQEVIDRLVHRHRNINCLKKMVGGIVALLVGVAIIFGGTAIARMLLDRMSPK